MDFTLFKSLLAKCQVSVRQVLGLEKRLSALEEGGGAGGNHAALSNLDYASAAHTGFQPALGFTAVPNTRTVNGQALTDNIIIDTGGDSVKKTYTQSSHGFIAGDVIYRSSGTWAKAKADAAATADVEGIVESIDGNEFVLVEAGEIAGLSGGTDGAVGFLSAATAGAITTTEPVTEGYISKPLLKYTSTTTAIVNIMRGVEVAPTSLDHGTLTGLSDYDHPQYQATSAMANYMATGERANYFYSSANTFANQTHDHGTSPSITGAVSVTSNSSGWSLNIGAYLTTAMQSACSSNFQSTGAYLTTAMQSACSSNFQSTGAYLTTAMQSACSSNFQSTGAYLTTAMQSVCTSALLNNFSIGGNTGTTNSSAIPGGAFLLAGGNNVTLSQSNNSISIHAAAGVGGGVGALGVTGSSNAFTSGSVMFSEQANITISSSINGASQYLRFSVAAPGGGAGATIQAYNPREAITGSLTSSHGTQYYFVPMYLENNLAMSKVQIVKSFNVGAGAFTSQNSRQSYTWTLYHGVTFFSRSNYAANSHQLVSVATGSVGFSLCGSYTSGSHSLQASYVTNSTGGTTSWSTASNGINYTSYWTGNKFLQIPLVTTLTPGEYWVAHRHSTNWATAGSASAKTWYSVSNLAMSNQISSVGGIGSNGSYVFKGLGGVGDGLGVCSGTTATMSASAISLSIPHYIYHNFVNLPVTTVLA